jgi:uncharacterized membrane protein YbhN (UPF0104 family)
MKRLLSIVGLLISFACILFFSRAIAHHWKAISDITWDSLAWISMIIALTMYVATYSLTAYAWNCSLRVLRHPIPYRIALRILALSQIAKYLPGNIGHHVGRVMLAKRAGISTDTILGSMILDTLSVLVAAGITSLWVIRLSIQVIRSQGAVITHAFVLMTAAGLILISAASLLPATRLFLSHQVRHLRHLMRMRNVPLLGKALIANAGSFLIGGTGLYLLCVAFSQNAPLSAIYLEVTSIYAAAWLLGFLIPGAPAGLGVREMALLLGLSPLFGNEAATAAAAVLRIITTMGDGLVFAAGLVLRNTGATYQGAKSGVN